MSYVYFLRPVGRDGPIKIGYSSCPASRLPAYAQWSPIPLELVAKIKFSGPGFDQRARRAERQFHTRYAKHWLHHEWFEAHPRILRDIALIAAGQFQIRCLPKPSAPIRTVGVWLDAIQQSRHCEPQVVAA